MEEESIWRKYSEASKHQNSFKNEDRNLRLQELDNGFFERFGTLLQDQTTNNVEDNTEDTETEENETEDIPEEDTEEIINNTIGLNIDELYSEVLYEILHIVGSDADNENKEELFQYLKDVFKVDDEKHTEFLKSAKDKEAPNILLNVEIIQGKDLAPKDANGLSDPFCTLYLGNNSTHRYNTSVKSETLSPIWEEHFSLPAENTAEDSLILEVWDFDPAETVREKITKISEVKGVRGLRKLMKEIAVTASTGKHDNEIIGTVKIPLKSVPASGHVKWYNLEKKSRNRGAIKVKLAFSSEKNNQVAAQEHRHLLRLILLQEIEQNKLDTATWDGKFKGAADIILRQHATQCGLRLADERMTQWVEFTNLHINNPINFNLFKDIIIDIKEPLLNGLYSEDEIRLFWNGLKKLLPSIFLKIRKLRKYTNDKTILNELDSMLKVISTVSSIDSDGIELFPKTSFGWLQTTEQSNDIVFNLKLAIKQSALEWFEQILENNKSNDISNDSKLKYAVKILQLIRGDLQKAIELFDKIFFTTNKIQYAMELYKIYDSKICELTKPLVTEICAALKPIKFKGNIPDIDNINSDDNLTVGTSLFELYLSLQRLLVLGEGMFPTDIESFQISKYHNWFHLGVAHWLDIAMYKAMQRIEKAVKLDELVPIDSSVKYSSSAVDTLSIFYQIKVFWKQLAWPDIEGAFTFVAKIMDDICRCSVYYADQMGQKVATLGESNSAYGQKFHVTNEWCLAINNIDYVRQSIEPFVTELGFDDIVTKLSIHNNEAAANHCKQTLNLVIDNAVDTVKNKIIDLLDTVAIKMAPVARRFLLEGAEIIDQGNNHVERLMQYLDDNLITLNSQLNNENFDRILSILWDKIYEILKEVVADSLEKRRPPNFFKNLANTLNILVGFFKQTENLENNNSYKEIKHVLELHGMGTEQLIHHYYLERLDEQNSIQCPTYGMITVRMQFVHYMLRIEILSARNLMPHDSNGSCDPFVKIHLLPEEKFANVNRPKTKIQKKNLFPLFDETFTLQLTKEQYEFKNALLHLIVKDEDFLGMSSQFVAEAFVLLSEIPRTSLETSLHEMAQVHLKLTKPTNHDTNIIKVLEHRQGEKLAKDFIKKLKVKMTVNTHSQKAELNGN